MRSDDDDRLQRHHGAMPMRHRALSGARAATELYHCHCSMCRRCTARCSRLTHGAPQQLVIEQGADNLSSFDSSAEVHRHFCRTCGCQLLLDDDRWPDLRWYTPGTCDGHPGHPPQARSISSSARSCLGIASPTAAAARGLLKPEQRGALIGQARHDGCRQATQYLVR